MLEPKRIEVELDDRLSDLAGGIRIVSCSYLSGEREQHVRDGFTARMSAAERGSKMTRAEIRERAKAEKDARVAAEKSGEKPKKSDPVEVALTVFPYDLVCRHTMQTVDGENVASQGPKLDKWLDGGVHRDVQRGIATQVLRESGHIDETEAQEGEDSGGSPDS